ncbi:hypothetical protein COU38_01905 [Candidatus Micrarchaeota archaeon CG10_big_fil_rev_8_21_14_0_10_54_18]|nr:MAG: hypothetical protein COT57_02595 [Candidatus Micrarchaeota archaeon CG09_land_8_20_14_0_10_55_25]PJD01257.1 MAG: hypothetical protein COU38_01905 [Candidatus Micrarchaeota archaeon CG10_big_fil_rev_8_21_14_0_10_54_18]
MNKSQSEWDSIYRMNPVAEFEAFRKYDEQDPYVKRMIKFAKGKRRSLEFGSGKGGLSLILKRNHPETETHLVDFSKNAVDTSKNCSNTMV